MANSLLWMRSRGHCSWVVAWCFLLVSHTQTELFVLPALPKSRAGQYWTVTCSSLLSNLPCPCFTLKILLEMPKGKKRGWRWLVVESSQVVVKLGQFENYWQLCECINYIWLVLVFGWNLHERKTSDSEEEITISLVPPCSKAGRAVCYHFHAPATWKWWTSLGNTCRIVCKTIKFPCQKQ